MGSQQSSHAKLRDISGSAKSPTSLACEDSKPFAAITESDHHLKALTDALESPTTTEGDDAATVSTLNTDTSLASEDWESDDEDDEEWEERLQILADARSLKQVASFFLHPELPVETSPTACARCYFDRPSATFETDPEERDAVFADLAALKKLAKEFLHPEAPVVTDPFVSGRNYFDRPSAVPTMDKEDAEERVRVLHEAKALKQLAVDFMHPELAVVTSDPAACGRNYFGRASAPAQDDADDEEARLLALADAKMLKQLAVEFMHPENPVITLDATACGRNFFTRPSATQQDAPEDEEERVRILEELSMLMKLAVDFMHPERPVITSDATACGRNFFSRASGPEYDAENEEERIRVFEEAKALKKLAVDYMHPELPVITSDPSACGRNYFSRASAIEQEDPSMEYERMLIMEDLKALKQKAVDFLHPELPTITTDPAAVGRNYFARADAPGHREMIHTFPRHEDDYTETLDHTDYHHEHLDHFGMDEDMDFTSMRGELKLPSNIIHQQAKLNMSEEEASNLSRSPSSVMLFVEESIYD